MTQRSTKNFEKLSISGKKIKMKEIYMNYFLKKEINYEK